MCGLIYYTFLDSDIDPCPNVRLHKKVCVFLFKESEATHVGISQ